MYFRRIRDDPTDEIASPGSRAAQEAAAARARSREERIEAQLIATTKLAEALGVKDALEENDADSPAVDDDAAAVAARHAREDILSSSALNAATLPLPRRAEYQADSEGSPGDGLAQRRAERPPQWVDCTDSGGEGYAPECDSELDMPGARRGGLSHIASMRGMWEQADSMEAQLEEAVSSSLKAAVAAARTAGQAHGHSPTAAAVSAGSTAAATASAMVASSNAGESVKQVAACFRWLQGELRAMDMDVTLPRHFLDTSLDTSSAAGDGRGRRPALALACNRR